MMVYAQDRVRQSVRQIVGKVPLATIEWFGQFPEKTLLYRIAKAGVYNRDVTIRQGVATQLKFNPGASNATYALGTNELPVQRAFADYLKPGDVFYDIGANVGFFTMIAAKLVGEAGRVYAFEPVPENYSLIDHNAKINHFCNISAFRKAVGSFSGKAELLLADYSGGSTLSVADTPPDLRGRMIVDVVTLDDLIAQKAISPPNMIKIDVEGAEMAVLQGMTQTIRNYRPIILYEVDDGNQNAFERKQLELQSFIQTFGYTTRVLEAGYPGLNWYVGHVLATPLLEDGK